MATNNAENSQFANNSDGFGLGGGTTARTLTVTGANITLTGSGTNVYTFPAATDTLVGRASTDTLTNKTLTKPVITTSTISPGEPAGEIVYSSGAVTLLISDGTTSHQVTTNDGTQTLTNKTLTSPTLTTPALGTATGTGLILTGSSATLLAAGLNGSTNPAFNVDASTATSATGLNIKSAAAAGGLAVSVLSSGAAENLTINAKGTGTIGIGSVSTGAVTVTPATTITGALTLSSTVNKVTITPPATSATLTLVTGSSLITAGAFATTLTSTAATNVTLPITGTLATLAGTETLTNKTITATSNSISTQTFTNPYKFSVYRNTAANSGNGAFALVTFDTKEFDTGTNYSTSTGLFTAPVAGFYYFGSTVATGATTTTFIASLYKNGSEIKRGTLAVVSNTASTSHVDSLVSLAANDTVSVEAFGNTTAALVTGSVFTYFYGYLVSIT